MFRARALLRVLLVVGIAALLLGDVWRGVHLLKTHHVLCPEHGELVDAEESEPGSAPRSGRAEMLPGGAAGHHHEHCGLAAVPSRSSHHAIASAGISLHASVHGTLLAPPRNEPAVSRAVIGYAPKQSPPRRST